VPCFLAEREVCPRAPFCEAKRRGLGARPLAVRGGGSATREKIRSIGSAPRERARGDYIFEWGEERQSLSIISPSMTVAGGLPLQISPFLRTFSSKLPKTVYPFC
jgi:hypothetical protein